MNRRMLMEVVDPSWLVIATEENDDDEKLCIKGDEGTKRSCKANNFLLSEVPFPRFLNCFQQNSLYFIFANCFHYNEKF